MIPWLSEDICATTCSIISYQWRLRGRGGSCSYLLNTEHSLKSHGRKIEGASTVDKGVGRPSKLMLMYRSQALEPPTRHLRLDQAGAVAGDEQQS